MSKKKQNANIGSLLISEQNCWCFVFFVVLFCLVFIKYLLQSELNKSYSNVKLIVYWWVLVKQEVLLPVELLRHNGMSFVRFLLKAGNGFLSVQTTIKWWFVRILLTSKNVSLLVKIMKTPYFKNSLKNPIFEIEDSNMDQMKENYLTHMNLVLTHFCQNVVLYGCCSQRLIYIYIYIYNT